LLPKMGTLPGTIHEQKVRCGKPNCKCTRGEPHRAYYRFRRGPEGRLRKAYVRLSELEETRAACEAWRSGNAAVLAKVKGPECVSVRREIRAVIRAIAGRENRIPHAGADTP
jgi:hypothetical protein